MSAPHRPAVRTAPTLLSVVHGRPTPEELAAVTAVLLASARIAQGRPRPGAPGRAGWSRPADGPALSWASPAAPRTWS
ncbi:acyl-CoA carboxylase subunit epsilon [Streptomyces sp. cmx-4-9]|uniref:acyl-CoA carboxylase subunit epsilon n=1 Tax=Streptomyces sp. cmx-4-9 TaxID=2790941 RepID=UPI003980C488